MMDDLYPLLLLVGLYACASTMVYLLLCLAMPFDEQKDTPPAKDPWDGRTYRPRQTIQK